MKKIILLIAACLIAWLAYTFFLNKADTTQAVSTPVEKSAAEIQLEADALNAANETNKVLIEDLDISSQIENALNEVSNETNLTSIENAELEASLLELEKQLEAQIKELEAAEAAEMMKN